ncbi:MAG: hypothetical protein LKI65_08700, partial [Prevotella sp.]|nr:hypothetical protein [Prevotella sp.]
MKLKTFVCISFVLWGLTASPVTARPFTFQEGKSTTLAFESSEAAVVKTVVGMFSGDYSQVFGGRVRLRQKEGNIIVGTLGSRLLKPIAGELPFLKGRHEAFLLLVRGGKLYVAGSEPRGTA